MTLRSRVVEYPDSPDRRTVYPGGLDDVATMSTWLTADCEGFVALTDWR